MTPATIPITYTYYIYLLHQNGNKICSFASRLLTTWFDRFRASSIEHTIPHHKDHAIPSKRRAMKHRITISNKHLNHNRHRSKSFQACVSCTHLTRAVFAVFAAFASRALYMWGSTGCLYMLAAPRKEPRRYTALLHALAMSVSMKSTNGYRGQNLPA